MYLTFSFGTITSVLTGYVYLISLGWFLVMITKSIWERLRKKATIINVGIALLNQAKVRHALSCV